MLTVQSIKHFPNQQITDVMREHQNVIESMINDPILQTNLNHIAITIARAFKAGNKVLICGNGGSAADSQHLAAEFTSTLTMSNLRPGLPAIALTTDTSFLTAYSNDFDFKTVFSRQVETLGNEGDVLICFSTSGNSENVINAAITANTKKMKVVGFSGKTGGKLVQCIGYGYSNVLIVPSNKTTHIQEAHMILYHLLVEMVEYYLGYSN